MEMLRQFISQSPTHSGVYRFIDISEKVLYVGKAKSLHKRLQSYLRDNLPLHIKEMVLHAVKVEWYLTSTEMEALFLEAELIETLKPIYNIQHKHGRNYTYMQLSKSEYPRLFYTRFWSEQSYGPFLSNEHVRNAIDGLYSVFQLRSCSDAMFKRRKKPCMEYDLGRCSAPCVNYISKEDYNINILNFQQLFTSTDNTIIDIWNEKIDQAIDNESYELANTINKRIQSFAILRNSLLEKVTLEHADFFISSIYLDVKCVHICSVRNYIIRHKIVMFTSNDERIVDFIARWSIKHKLSEQIYVNENIEQTDQFLQLKKPVKTAGNLRLKGIKKLNMNDLDIGLYQIRRLTTKIYSNLQKIEEVGLKCARSEVDNGTKYQAFAKRLDVKALNRVEVYDNSHMGGKWNVGVKIVWTATGFIRSAYQVFKYEQQTHDDYAMMRELFQRRFCTYNHYNNEVEQSWPDLVIIDGGAGQLSVAMKYIPVKHYALSKHVEGDQLHTIENGQFKILEIDTDLRLWLMKLRDEAHRFAVQSHTILKEQNIPG